LEGDDGLYLKPENSVLTKELNQLLDTAIQQLSDRQRLAFIMKHINGMKVDEIAQVLNCQPSTVKIHLFRAVRNLQKKIIPYLAAN
jgi:RNA polymerase sigma-70 factor (ECF subfamily)